MYRSGSMPVEFIIVRYCWSCPRCRWPVRLCPAALFSMQVSSSYPTAACGLSIVFVGCLASAEVSRYSAYHPESPSQAWPDLSKYPEVTHPHPTLSSRQ